ncbi:MAG TPA: methyl-accepting chemotaxis protein [Burkholderiaceae bacterium]|nr:methyl-accepting chemotaxis protein [Burkholderiaceae bacterium]
MMQLLRRAPRESTEMPALAPAAPAPDLHGAIRSIGQQAARIGREAAEVRGLIDDTAKVSERSGQAVATMLAQMKEVQQAQAGIGSVSQAGLGAVERVRGAVEDVGREVGAAVTTLREVANAAEGISRIALQTRLVAFNASVEAKRAGDAGRGFGVVADAVRDLAGQVDESSKEIMRTVGALDARIAALARELRTENGRGERGAFHAAIGEVQGAVDGILAAAGQSRATCGTLDAQLAAIAGDIGQTGQTLAAAMTRSEAFLGVSEQLIELVADCGIETEDTPFIIGATGAAREVGALLEAAVAAGEATLADLFDEAYVAIPNTNPAQHTTRFVALADRLFPDVQERVLKLSPKVVFCIAADRNGFVATHNRQYNHPQRGDLAWDSANSRYRRIFADRTGLASARNQRPFLLQTYRRDMGGGRFVVMKEAAAPIVVGGRHWGGLRLAFQF